MPRPDGQQFQQLKMFMTPEEIAPKGTIDHEVSVSYDYPEEDRKAAFDYTMRVKKSNASDDGMDKDIQKYGVEVPIQVVHDPVLGNVIGHGNHRFASSPPGSLIPVIHTEGVPDEDGLDVYEAMDDDEGYMKDTGHGIMGGRRDSWRAKKAERGEGA